MSMMLGAEDLRTYNDHGVLFPKRVMTADEANHYREEWEGYERESGGPVNGKYRYKAHLLFPFADRIMRNPGILDMVESILGPDILAWNTHLYPKEPGDGRFISWHQDSAHWGLDSNRIVTVWVALSATTRENGCMAMLPGSHRQGTVKHDDTWDPGNILTRGQTIAEEIDESKAVWVELEPGEASLHHVEMMHGSPANVSDGRRVALAARYITPAARQIRHDVDFATLVRGEDRFGHFETEQAPQSAMHPDAVAFHEKVAESQGKIMLHGTDRAGTQGLTETNNFRDAS